MGGFLGGAVFYFMLGGLFFSLFGKESFGVYLLMALALETGIIFWRYLRKQYVLCYRFRRSVITTPILFLLLVIWDEAGIFLAVGKMLLTLVMAFPGIVSVTGLFKPQWIRWKLRKIPYLSKSPHAEKKQLVFWGSVGLLGAGILSIFLFL